MVVKRERERGNFATDSFNFFVSPFPPPPPPPRALRPSPARKKLGHHEPELDCLHLARGAAAGPYHRRARKPSFRISLLAHLSLGRRN